MWYEIGIGLGIDRNIFSDILFAVRRIYKQMNLLKERKVQDGSTKLGCFYFGTSNSFHFGTSKS